MKSCDLEFQHCWSQSFYTAFKLRLNQMVGSRGRRLHTDGSADWPTELPHIWPTRPATADVTLGFTQHCVETHRQLPPDLRPGAASGAHGRASRRRRVDAGRGPAGRPNLPVTTPKVMSSFWTRDKEDDEEVSLGRIYCKYIFGGSCGLYLDIVGVTLRARALTVGHCRHIESK